MSWGRVPLSQAAFHCRPALQHSGLLKIKLYPLLMPVSIIVWLFSVSHSPSSSIRMPHCTVATPAVTTLPVRSCSALSYTRTRDLTTLFRPRHIERPLRFPFRADGMSTG
ncbi:hypothetical protein NEOLEDRAFT_697957 [Neolentinus lepideus HHB14362 ss-1]|uniref:Uncharacterized protein n=1 Tax=Neolentinus lepideus HHB14362 ss-1 TaxID=1314782 RepID=A0A165V319_9AGAM|nr:hypothetical protein NEOLEDRAFT_697957 [Neolentinus lepideus HHB14362 ss-1]